MAELVTLADAIERINTAIAGLLTAAQDDGLDDVRAVLVGDRARTGFDLPVLWVMNEPASNVQSHALQEHWELPVVLIAVVQGDEPDVAARLAADIAARARTVAVYGGGRRLGLSFVDDIQSTSFEAARQSALNNRTLYSAAATVTVRFRVFERPAG